MRSGPPVATLVARLEHRLETARLVMQATHAAPSAQGAIVDAQALVAEIREAL